MALSDPVLVLREAETLAYGANMLLQYAKDGKGNALRAQVHSLAGQLQALADAIEPPPDPSKVLADLIEVCRRVGNLEPCDHTDSDPCNVASLNHAYDLLAGAMDAAADALDYAEDSKVQDAARALQ